MPSIKIKRAHSLSRDGAKKKVEALAKSLKKEMKGGEWEWIREYTLEGTAPGINSGRITVSDKFIDVTIDVPFYVPSALVRGAVLDRLDTHFPGP